jgi:LPS export ABC transporter permease LptG/LPS export ABC transporter permease LptF
MFRTILDRYVIRQVVAPFTIVLLVFTFMLEMDPLMGVAAQLVAKGVAWSVVARILPTLLPQALVLTIPMALLIGLLIAFGRLSEDREWVALQACGVSHYRLLRPVAVLAIAGWALTSWVYIVAVPNANQAYREIIYSVVAARAEGEVKPHVFFQDFRDQVLYVRDVRPGAPGWFDVFLADTSKEKPVIFTARHGQMLLDRKKRTVDMVLEDGTQHALDGDKYSINPFTTLRISLDPETVFPRSGPAKGEREMTIAELRAAAAEVRRLGGSPYGQLMEIHKKFSIPAACLVFAVIALGLGVNNRKDGKFASFIFGVAVIFLYYIFLWLGQSMVKGQQVPAWFGMWLPNFILGPIGLATLLWRARSSGDRGFTVPLLARLRDGSRRGTPRSSAAGLRARLRVPRLSMLRASILDGYVARLYLRIFALAFGGLMGIFYIATFVERSERLFKGSATMAMLARLLVVQTPQFIYFVIPISALIATLVTIGLLTRNSELIVMKACGISLYRVAVPMLLFGVIWSSALFFLEESVMPTTNRQADDLMRQMRGGSPRTIDVLNRRWVVGRGGQIYNYVSFDPRRNEMYGLSIFEFDPRSWGLKRRTYVTQATFAPAAGKDRAASVAWRARDGWVREFADTSAAAAVRPVARPGPAKEDGTKNYAPFKEMTVQLEQPDYFGAEEPKAERMNYLVLRHYIEDLRAAGFNVVPYVVQLHQKIAFPFVALIMTLIAVPFAVTMGRHGAMYGLGLGVALALTYWICNQIFGAIGSGGLVVPLLAAWAPNLLFGAAAAYLLLTVKT